MESSESPEQKGQLKIIHFNDCYNISEKGADNCGGIPRFVSLLKSFPQPKVTLFSGDLWSPSLHTSIFQGEQLVNPINACEIDCACLGNHDFDLGLERLQYLNSKTNFPWLLTNLTNLNGTRFVSSLAYHIVEKDGYKLGLIGLIEYDWITTLTCLDVEDITYEDFVSAGERLATQLKEDYSCDLIVALTHMRLPNDRRLAKLCQEIDLVLGGHDHLFGIEKHGECLVVKSGTDFLTLSEINIVPWDAQDFEGHTEPVSDENAKSNHSYCYLLKNKWKVEVIKRDVVKSIVPDPEMLAHNEKYEEKMQAQLKTPLFFCDTPLETKFAIIRSCEASIGNFMADLMRKELTADVSLYNGGSIRSDFSYTQRLYVSGDLQNINPYEEKVLLVEVKGKTLLEALENSVSKLPSLEGRFCHVSHIKMEWDPSKPAGQRVNRKTLVVDSDPFEEERLYRLGITNYMRMGKDGFECFKDAKLLSASENVRTMSEILFDFFNLTKNTEYIDEYRVYSLYKDELTVNFIKLKIQGKVEKSILMAKQAQKWAHQDDQVLTDNPEPTSTLRRSLSNRRMDSHEFTESDLSLHKALSRTEDSEGLTVIKLLTRFNVDLLMKRKAILSMDCLIRLRKYQLIKAMEKGPNKQILPVIAPTVEHRIVEKPF